MSKSKDEPYFVNFELVPDKEDGGMNIQMTCNLPEDEEMAMIYIGMLSQINQGDCSNLMLETLYIESRIQRNEVFQRISENWQNEIEAQHKEETKSTKSIVSPLRVFGASNL